MANFPQDPFDEVPAELKRVGAHRAPRPRGRGAIAFAWAALATGILVVGGLYGLSRIDPTFNFSFPGIGAGDEDPVATPSASGPAVEAVTDPTTVDPALALSISVFNGSATDGLQNTAGDAIAAAGWPDPARAVADQRDETATVVYYRSAEFEGIALGLVQLLGVGTVQLSDAFLGAPVTIVVGSDYATVSGAAG
jgi:hypothetical protein